MQSPLKGQQKSGWTASYQQQQDGPKTVERKRRGRGVDIISSSLPTPPSQSSSHLPTPETVRRSSRPRKSLPSTSTSSITQLPTPQTQRTKRRLSPAIIEETEEEEPIPSPSGHTTFFLSNNASSSSRPEKIRRRPGLTFAQQMGLLNTGKGVGMGGGHKSGIHGKVDQIGGASGNEKERGAVVKEDNPFLVSGLGVGLGAPIPIPSPGQITIHHPGGDEEGFDSDTEGLPSLAPRRSPRLASPIPSSSTKPTLAQSISPTGLLSPPPTKHAARIASSPSSSKAKGITRLENSRRKKIEEEQKQMMDYESNPFLLKPGEPSTRIPKTKGPIVDEDLPTVTYVFRGSKKVFANPLYPSNSVFPRSELDPEDEEFEPNPLPKPKLLWPTGPSPSSASRARREIRTPSPDNDRSPPSSPVSTPTRSTRFGNSNLSLSVGPRGKDEGIYSDDEGEVMMRDIRGEEAEGEELPSRRGMLFGGIGGAKGVKRSNVDELEGSGSGTSAGRGKKARGLLRL
ncbi:hypothetical protein I302_108874 [Kwoniella bestiolae CBS 10118]|uniref:Uncharacterized protein n=1 Tax=Kwoniella bestiolae CBS 10118 TaxID=1296100 RepID=A0A1B9FUC4_9TREE|nr:hypothetical protein I302_08011 [Kwoniella bestiolae CBS 10118]OCF22364.1 hypothetical protein I302_08011 [Kwoniella bestiolae CBS 10118]